MKSKQKSALKKHHTLFPYVQSNGLISPITNSKYYKLNPDNFLFINSSPQNQHLPQKTLTNTLELSQLNNSLQATNISISNNSIKKNKFQSFASSSRLNTLSTSPKKISIKHSINLQNKKPPSKALSSANFCLISKRTLFTKKSEPSFLKHHNNSNNKINTINKQITFSNEVINSIFKNNKKLLKIKTCIKNNVRQNLFGKCDKRRQRFETIDNNECSNFKIWKKNKIKCLSLSDDKKERNNIDNEECGFYSSRDIRTHTRTNDDYVKETVRNLRRTQILNDENISKISFIKRTLYK